MVVTNTYAHMLSVTSAQCPAVLIVYFNEEEKKGITNDREYKSHTWIADHNGTFEGNDHEMFDSGDMSNVGSTKVLQCMRLIMNHREIILAQRKIWLRDFNQ
eukprot:204356_1